MREAHHLGALLGRAVGDDVAADLVDLQHVVVDAGKLVVAGSTNGADHALVHPEDERDFSQDLLVLQELDPGGRERLDQLLPLLVEELHDQANEPLLLFRRSRADHVADRLEVGADVQVLQLGDVLRDVAHHLLDEGHLLTVLDHDKLPFALLTDLEEGVDGHLLDPGEGLVHKFEELEDDCLQKLPVRSQEAWVLAHDIHDVAGHHSLVLLAALHLTEAQQVLDDGHQESLLIDLLHRAADGADGPAEAVQQRRRPALRGALREALLSQALQHDVLHVAGVQVREVDQRLTHHLVERDLVRVLLLSTDDVTLLVLLDGDLRRLRHLGDEDTANLGEHRAVELHLVGAAERVHAVAAVEQQRRRGVVRLALLHLLVLQEDPRAEGLPELHADLERLLVRAHRDADQVVQRRNHVRLLSLHRRHVVLQEPRQEQSHLVVEDLPEDPLRTRELRAGLRRVLGELLHLLDDPLEAPHELRLILLHTLMQARDLVETLGAFDPVLQRVPEVDQQGLDEVGLEDVAQRDPLQEIGERRQRRRQERHLHGARGGHVALEDEVAQLVDRGELRVQRLFQPRQLPGDHVRLAEREDLLAQQVQDA
mmetsp:Transcript_23028/g.68544  ORF Transcript_23028/g.68544 Transcript_23028/m.68544 type:complete len:597 (-) Transcript_23028:505-2295(-)